ncbi:MAG: sulfotransferase [Pseudomonadales bacterium]|nr:sulfotransferase [Pseudomonadales bacterium]
MSSDSGPVVDFFLVGAAKAGSTTLYRILDTHPQVFMSDPKETNFFTHREIGEHAFLGKVPAVSREVDYQRLFEAALPGQVRGEASVSYLSLPGVAQKIARYNPAAKIVVSLRDPVMRAISHHAMDQKLGFCRHSLEAIFHSPSRYPNHFFQYFDNGLYCARLREYLSVFPRERLHVILFPDLVHRQQSCIADLLSFLGVAADQLPELNLRENARSVPRNRVYGFLYQRASLRSLLKRVLPAKYRAGIQASILSREEGPVFERGFMQEMYDFYQDDLAELADLLGGGPVVLAETSS